MDHSFYVYMITIWVAVTVAAASPLSDAKELSFEEMLDQQAYLLQNRKKSRTSTNTVAAQSCSGWGWVKCGGQVAKCAADCAQGITSSQCFSCLGSSYDECKNCFSRMEEVLAHDAIADDASNQVANAQSCNGWKWVKCGGKVAICTANCARGITSSQCISCLGSSYYACKNCFSLIMMEEVQETHIQKAAHCSGKPIFGFFRHKHNCFNKNGKCCATNRDGTGTVSKADNSQNFCGYCFTGRPGLLVEEIKSFD